MQGDMNEGYNSFIKAEEKSNNQLILTLIAFLFFIVVLGSVFVRYQRKMIFFINSMKNNLSQISKQNWEIADLENQSFAEFNDLSESINLMKFKLHDYFSRIQEQNEIENNIQLI